MIWIGISIPLLVVALALLAFGALTSQSLVVAASIGVCLLAALLLYVGTRRGRNRSRSANGTGQRPNVPVSAPQRRGATSTTRTSTTRTSTTLANPPEAPEPAMGELLEHPLAARRSDAIDGDRRASVSQLPVRRQRRRDPDDPPDEPDIESFGDREHSSHHPHRAAPQDLTAVVDNRDDEVVVVDGRPRFHLAHCDHLRRISAGRPATRPISTDPDDVTGDREPLPLWEAVELGFTPCARCAPIAGLVPVTRGVADS